MLGILYNYAYDYLRQGYKLKPNPNEWDETTKELMESNDSFKTVLEEHFEEGPSFRVGRYEIENRIELTGIKMGNRSLTWNDIRSSLEKRRFKWNKNTSFSVRMIFGMRKKL